LAGHLLVNIGVRVHDAVTVQSVLVRVKCILLPIDKTSAVYAEVSQRAKALISDTNSDFFSSRRVGLEKETLRIDSKGKIAQSDHPEGLGSALCHPHVTTDFSESLLEMVTPPCPSVTQALDYMVGIHQFILPRLLDGEGLWNTSMPCVIGDDDSIRIGQYGHSHNGIMKQVYRRGLGLRYGRRMQAIAGIHFNYSMPEASWPVWQALHKAKPCSQHPISTTGYFHMTRNMMRVGWLIPYLFGASPAICQTFLPSGQDSDLATLNKNTRYAPHGTSLRMGEIGYRYKEDAPIDLSVRHDSFENYLQDIYTHVTTEHAPYKQAGVQDERGQFHQINANKLQIENEYYSSVRPKQIPQKGEMPLLALKRCGIRYLELRSVDVNVYDQVGMHEQQLAMLEMLMIFAWLADSPPLLSEEMNVNKQNIKTVAHRGREPGLKLMHNDNAVPLVDWGKAVLENLAPIASWMDNLALQSNESGNGLAHDAANRSKKGTLYQASLQAQMAKLDDSALTPSAKVIDELDQHGSFFGLVMAHSSAQKESLLNQATDNALQDSLQQAVVDSIAAQQLQEQNSTGSFDEFLADYSSQLSTWNKSRS